MAPATDPNRFTTIGKPHAITTDDGGATVSVEVEGKSLEVFGFRTYNKGTARHYEGHVIAESGKAFTLLCDISVEGSRTATAKYPHVEMYYKVDGITIRTYVVRTRDNFQTEGPLIDHTSSRTLCFQEPRLTESGQLVEEDIKAIGTIEVELGRVRCGGNERKRGHETLKQCTMTESIPENAKKGLVSLTTRLGAPVSSKQTSTIDILAREADAFAVLTFRYNTEAVLRAQGIIPPDPSRAIRPHRGLPHPTARVTGSSSDRDNNESSDEESLEKIEQKIQLLAVKAKRMKLAERQRKIEVGQMAMGPHNVTQLNEQLWDALREQEKTRIEQAALDAEEARLTALTARRKRSGSSTSDEDSKAHIHKKARKALADSLIAAKARDNGATIDLCSD